MHNLARELELEREAELRRARQSFLAFCHYVTPEFRGNWHITEIARAVDQIAFGELSRFFLAMPPQHGKSTLMSVHAPAFFLGVNGNNRILAASYAANLSTSLNRQVQRLMERPSYRRVFPNTQLAGTEEGSDKTVLRTQNAFEVSGHKGYLRSSGVMGSATGFAADIIIIDDAHKNAEEADSAVIRERTWKWFQTVMLLRLQKKGALICLGTRWRQDDFLSNILTMAEKASADMPWRVISLPAVAEGDQDNYDKRKPGQALWAERFDEKALVERRAAIGERAWLALYQQSPAPAGGNYLRTTWMQRCKELPSDLKNYTLSVDLTFKNTGDYAAFGVFASKGPNHYVVEMIEQRLDFNEQLAMFRALAGKYPGMQVKLVEEAANGAALMATLKQQIAGIIAVKPRTSKELRVQAVSPMFEAGNVIIPEAPWADKLITQLCTFPAAAHDDMTDATVQYLLYAQQKRQDFSSLRAFGVKRDDTLGWR